MSCRHTSYGSPHLQAALGSRQNQISALGGVTPDKSWLDKWGGAVLGGAGLAFGGGGKK